MNKKGNPIMDENKDNFKQDLNKDNDNKDNDNKDNDNKDNDNKDNDNKEEEVVKKSSSPWPKKDKPKRNRVGWLVDMD